MTLHAYLNQVRPSSLSPSNVTTLSCPTGFNSEVSGVLDAGKLPDGALQCTAAYCSLYSTIHVYLNCNEQNHIGKLLVPLSGKIVMEINETCGN